MHYALLASVWPNKWPPLLNTVSSEADVHGAQRVLSNNSFRMANCFCCLSQNAMLTAVKNYNKVLKSCKTFSSRPRPRPNVQDQDQDFNFCPRGASRPRPCTLGLQYHCVKTTFVYLHRRYVLLWHFSAFQSSSFEDQFLDFTQNIMIP